MYTITIHKDNVRIAYIIDTQGLDDGGENTAENK